MRSLRQGWGPLLLFPSVHWRFSFLTISSLWWELPGGMEKRQGIGRASLMSSDLTCMQCHLGFADAQHHPPQGTATAVTCCFFWLHFMVHLSLPWLFGIGVSFKISPGYISLTSGPLTQLWGLNEIIYVNHSSWPVFEQVKGWCNL